ncbi:MAG TPA: YggT family protein [Chloroflexota bacterium]|nr:YggT family protein [Chloroflexota bacterium]
MSGVGILANFISIFALVLTWAIIIRALLSWFSISGSQPLFRLLMEITEPILAPIRRILPGGMMLDFSPLIAILLIQLVSNFVINQLPS